MESARAVSAVCGLFKSVLEKGGPLVVALSNCGCLAGPEVGGGKGTGLDLLSVTWGLT